jgi:hypothetical protein
MRRLLIGLGWVALAALCVLVIPHARHMSPAICISVVEENGRDGSSTLVPAIDGYSVSHCWLTSFDPKGSYDIMKSYKVAASSPGHLFVLAHYTISRPGENTVVDRALPVANQKPGEPGWSKIDDHLRAFAYLSDSTISY